MNAPPSAATDPIGDFDHCMLLVADLDAADRALLQLGFRPTPRGLHSASMGTANATTVFRNGTYLETLGVVAPTAANQGQRERLAEGPGAYGLAFKTPDAEAAAAIFAAAGLGEPGTQGFVRPVELGGTTREASFTVARTTPGSLPAGWLFCCQHHTPELVWRADHQDHPNGASSLVELLGVAEDLAALAHSWSIMGGRVRLEPPAVVIASTTADIRFLTPSAYVARLGEAALPGLPVPAVGAFTLRTGSLAACERLLRANGLNLGVTADGRLVVPRIPALGCMFEFVQG